jgi:hypothetical protein
MTDRETNGANFFETVLSGAVGPTDLTYNVASNPLASPVFIVINPTNPVLREVILADGAFTGAQFSSSDISSRYQDGSAAASGLTHETGAKVWVAPLWQHIEDLNDRIDAAVAAAEPVGAAAGAVSAHAGAADPHIGYQKESEKGAANGYAPLGADAKVPAANLPDSNATSSVLIRKSADQSRASTTTRADDSELLFPIAANETWIGEILILIGTGAEAADISVQLAGPTGSTVDYGVMGLASTATSEVGSLVAFAGAVGLAVDDTFVTVASIRFSIANGSTAGNLAFRWAQNASSATPTVVKRGSHLAAHKVA